MRRRNFFFSSAASLLGSVVSLARERVPWIGSRGSGPKLAARADEGTGAAVDSPSVFAEAVAVPDSWEPSVPAPRIDFGIAPLHYETTFWELRPGRLAPINTKTSVGVPGWPVMGFGYLMRARYSEFQMRFSLDKGGKEAQPHTLEKFRQYSPRDWLPGAVSEWEEGGVHYEVSYIVVPNEPQPVDLYQIRLQNRGKEEAHAHLLVTLDGAATLKAEGELIEDRGKPLVMMDPVVPVERIARPSGCVDPRATPSGPWGFGSMEMGEWLSHRDGWYGMPIEYLLRARAGETLQVFLGFGGTPQTYLDWTIKTPPGEEDPALAVKYPSPDREITATVEGDPKAQRVTLTGYKHLVLGFSGRDTDGDGYVKISVRATAESRQPAVLAVIWAFDAGTTVSAAQLLNGDTVPSGRYRIDVGEDLPRDIGGEWAHLGSDPTAFALRLRYEPTLGPGEEKTYLLRLPAIDKPEMAPYGNPWRPYDTGESWKMYMEARHPENKTPYGEDVPPGIDPREYGIFGPKPRAVWTAQLAAARKISWPEATNRLGHYWDDFVAKAAKFLTPEPYLDHLYKHQLAVLNMQRIRMIPTDYELQMVGPDWYWDELASRDVPYIIRSWDLAGFHDIAAKLWQPMLTPSPELPRSRWALGQWVGGPEHDGLWLTRGGQWDAQGQTIWGLDLHSLLTGDPSYLVSNYAQLARGADWIIRAIQREKDRLGDPAAVGYGMLPRAGGEAGGPGHNFYVNSYAVLGLNRAARVADATGHLQDGERYRTQAAELQKVLHAAIRNAFFTYSDFSGTIPYGQEWRPDPKSYKERGGRNVTTARPNTDYGCPLVWPNEAVAPFDPLMNAWCRHREVEAESTGGLFDWPYIAVDWGLGYIRRGEPDRAADWFYAYVDHAALTLDWGENVKVDSAFPEFLPPRKGIRTEGQMPHGWASAMYISYLRNLLLHEEGDTLHIAPATPRKWLAQPRPIGVENAPSEFGNVTYYLQADPDRTTLKADIRLDFGRHPSRLLVHLRAPGGRGLKEIKVNGEAWKAFDRETVIIPNPDSDLRISAKLI